jgi:signal transduction histidine kinase
MGERVSLAGGSLSIEDCNPGTLVRARLPVHRRAEGEKKARAAGVDRAAS